MNQPPRKLICILSLIYLFAVSSCSAPSLIGSWRRIDKPFANNIKPADSIGDMTLRADSTFFIQGSPAADSSRISGWNTGSISGRWGLTHPNLMMQTMNPEDDKMILPRPIVRLTAKRLYLQLGGAGPVLKYRRIKNRTK